jgi:uncharacterized protein YcbK (DUF882 family)
MKRPNRRRYKQPRRRHPLLRADLATVVVAICAAIGVIQFYRPTTALGRTPFSEIAGPIASLGSPSGNAFGRSGEVKLLFAMPGERVVFPLAAADPTALTYEWTSLRGTETGFVPQTLQGAAVAAPLVPGFYYLTLINGEERQILKEPTVAVMRPFHEKLGVMLNGYKIGTYLGERLRGIAGDRERPDGFLEVWPQYMDLAVSKHLRLRHFLTHDNQANVWPKYVALNPRLLDKLELVFAELEANRGAEAPPLDLDVHSGYRTPAHNRQVVKAARDSRHQYGDAADVVVDANGNGYIDRSDHRLVVAAVDNVERTHPDLIGGLGVYASRRYPTPYVHIDARGKRSRWRG